MIRTINRVVELTHDISGIKIERLGVHSAIDHDMGMSGGDVVDLIEALEREYGEWVWAWPWRRFVTLDEGLSPLFPFVLAWQLFTWPFRGSFEYPNPLERLELGHIAAVIDKGEWFEP